jgi:hypothetical protein
MASHAQLPVIYRELDQVRDDSGAHRDLRDANAWTCSKSHSAVLHDGSELTHAVRILGETMTNSYSLTTSSPAIVERPW